MYYAFIRPPVFGGRNALRFARELYQYILRGNDDELKIIAHELSRSAKSLVIHSKQMRPKTSETTTSADQMKKRKPQVEDYAFDILLLIADRKFCRNVVASSPVTAQAFFEEMASAQKYQIPIGQFSRNILSEAVAQKGSFLYTEAAGFSSGLLGHLKPVSQAMYGNYELLESLNRYSLSPLEVNYEERWAWDAHQWRAYCQATLFTFKDYIYRGFGSRTSYALNQAIDHVKCCYRDLHRVDESPNTYETDTYKRFSVAVQFVRDAIDIIDQDPNPPAPLVRVREDTYPKNIYDHLALLIFDMCTSASWVKSPVQTCWSVHYLTLWSTLFHNFQTAPAWKIVRHKVRRLIYDEILRLQEFPNYKGSAILGLCLNVFGMSVGSSKQNFGRDSYALTKAIHSWTKRHYLWLRQQNPDVADSVLIGSVSFEEERCRLVKTYIKGLNREAPKSYLDLDQPASSIQS